MAALLTLFRHATRADLPVPDPALLDRFAIGRDEDAFAELIRRHGPVVYRICRRLVGASAADDAFQATFLVLATRLDTARAAGSVAGWLVGVAGRVARQMRRSAARRTHHETAAATARSADGAAHSVDLADQFRLLDEELARLPARLRDPVVLCLLQGRTQEDAARELGRDARTLRRRLERAKKVLRARLERRGVVPAVASGLITAAGSVSATVPPDLSNRTVSTVFDFLTGGASRLAPVILAKGVATSMFSRKLTHLMAVAVFGLIGVGVVLADDPRPAPTAATTQAAPATVPSPPTPAAPARAEFHHAPVADRMIAIQALCLQAPEGFCERIGLVDEASRPQPGLTPEGWILSRRESRMLTALIRAEKEKGGVEILSRPQIITSDKQAAFVQTGHEVPVPVNVSKNGAVAVGAVEARQVGHILRVTPQVLPNGTILLVAEMQHTSVAPQLVELGNGVNSPVFNIQTVKTNSLVPDGGSAVVQVSTLRPDDGKKSEVFWVLTPQIVKAPPAVLPSARRWVPVAPQVPAPVPVQPQPLLFMPAAPVVPPDAGTPPPMPTPMPTPMPPPSARP